MNSRWPKTPVRRLYGAARWLAETYLKRIAESGVDAIFLLGDTLDPADREGLEWLRRQIDECAVSVHVLIGNHETWGGMSAEQFHMALGLPEHGNRLVRIREVPFLLLATPDQDSFSPGQPDFDWLRGQLETITSQEDIFCCAHFSLLLHPCVQGWKNDGMQVLWSGDAVMRLLKQFPNVRAWIAGHKNIPSVVERNGMLHLLSPQLIQAPCAYRILDIHSQGIRSQVHAIEEQDLAELSRRAYGPNYQERCGTKEARDFFWSWPQ